MGSLIITIAIINFHFFPQLMNKRFYSFFLPENIIRNSSTLGYNVIRCPFEGYPLQTTNSLHQGIRLTCKLNNLY